MKILLLFFIGFLSLNAFAYNDSYRVSGFDDKGEPVIGTIYTHNEPLEVDGEIMYQDGYTHDFYGRWNGKGEITGQTDDGATVDLQTR